MGRRQGVQPRDEFFHLPLTLEPGCIQNFLVVLLSQMVSKESHRREVHPSLFEHLQDAWKPPDCPRRDDAAKSGRLRERKLLCAIGEQRRVAFSEVELPCVQFGEVCDHRSRRLTLAFGQRLDPLKQLVVGQLIESTENFGVHALCISRDFRAA